MNKLRSNEKQMHFCKMIGKLVNALIVVIVAVGFLLLLEFSAVSSCMSLCRYKEKHYVNIKSSSDCI